MEKCLALRQYAKFVAEVRNSVSSGEDRETAIKIAIDNIVAEEQGLSEFFRKHRAEVTDVFLEEYNEDEVHQVFREDGYDEGLEHGLEQGREEGREEGREQGREEGRLTQLVDLVKKGLLPADVAAKEAGLPTEEFRALLT